MARARLPKQVEEEVLVLSRRRCAICYGLNRDTGLKSGQIAHLDRKKSNNDLDNLAYLCLTHHDQYDSRTSQSKGLTTSEVRRYRKELHEAIDLAWRKPVTFGEVSIGPADKISGHYIRETEWESAELEVRALPDGRVHVTGLALWGSGREFGPNLGDLDFEAPIDGNRVTFTDGSGESEYRLVLEFEAGRLNATENYVIGYFGMNVSFEGRYIKADAAA